MAESDPEVEEESGVHKKTGDTHKSKWFSDSSHVNQRVFLGIKVKKQMEVPPENFPAEEKKDEQTEEVPSDSKMEE